MCASSACLRATPSSINESRLLFPDQLGASFFFEAASVRSHKEACTGCTLSLTVPTQFVIQCLSVLPKNHSFG
jgi:hypothetical protein